MTTILQTESARLIQPSKVNTPLVEVGDNRLDWEATLDPPARASGTVNVRLMYAGRNKPLVVSDPTQEHTNP